jgi:hypothetical protein
VTKAGRRRLVALLLPIPVIAAGIAYVKYARPTGTVEAALTFPRMCLWYLGLKSPGVAGALAVGYWYLVLSLLSYALLCGRDRLSKAMLVCLVATSAIIGAVMLLLRGFDAD